MRSRSQREGGNQYLWGFFVCFAASDPLSRPKKRHGLRLVQTHEIDLPVGTWGKGEQRRIGDLLAKDMLTGFPGLKEPCCALLHLSPDEFDRVIRALPEEWTRLKTLYRFYAAYGMR